MSGRDLRKFTNHHSAIKASKSALESMDSFFAQLQLKTSQKKFYEQTWFLILVGAVLLLLILGIGAFFVIRSRKTKEPRELNSSKCDKVSYLLYCITSRDERKRFTEIYGRRFIFEMKNATKKLSTDKM
ncbi:Protein CBG15653 [Caenorhabditis briggsae]|uniref:Protein CBG15653 n=1 Tax=Caenorhabditis briggsae TaxID=6238 RepID=A8XMG6_CAEBR|nr:Protein CBG15653 [Caenorhabditis briggsae]CAP33842.2 Protein CBG15653 [Caenorhabditis briggsae]